MSEQRRSMQYAPQVPPTCSFVREAKKKFRIPATILVTIRIFKQICKKNMKEGRKFQIKGLISSK